MTVSELLPYLLILSESMLSFENILLRCSLLAKQVIFYSYGTNLLNCFGMFYIFSACINKTSYVNNSQLEKKSHIH